MSEHDFEVGQVVQLKSGGPSFVLTQVGGTYLNGTYYNPVTGLVVSCQAPADCVRLVPEDVRGGNKR